MSLRRMLSIRLTEQGRRYADKHGEWPKYILAETDAYECLAADYPNTLQTVSGEIHWKGIVLLRIASPGNRVFLAGNPLEVHVEEQRKSEPFVWTGE